MDRKTAEGTGWPTLLTTKWTYDGAGRIDDLKHFKADGTTWPVTRRTDSTETRSTGALMTANDISDKLRALDLSHREDGDGGYALVGEVLQYAGTLSASDQDLLRRELLQLVDVQDRTMWGVALEALIQGWDSRVAVDLDSLLQRREHSDEWKGFILSALLRLGYQPIAKDGTNYISQHLKAGDDTVLPILAALCKVDADRCLDMTGCFFIDQFSRGRLEDLTGYMPAFGSNFLDVDANLLVMLVRKILARPSAATN
jgi:hypothetical protein